MVARSSYSQRQMFNCSKAQIFEWKSNLQRQKYRRTRRKTHCVPNPCPHRFANQLLYWPLLDQLQKLFLSDGFRPPFPQCSSVGIVNKSINACTCVTMALVIRKVSEPYDKQHFRSWSKRLMQQQNSNRCFKILYLHTNFSLRHVSKCSFFN